MGDGEGVREGSPDHAARVRCSMVAGLHPGALLPISLYGNGSGRPLPHTLAAAHRVHRLELRPLHAAARSTQPRERSSARALRSAVAANTLRGAKEGVGRRAKPRRPGLLLRQALRFLEKKSVQRFQASVAAAAL